jgi:hypothetical protein
MMFPRAEESVPLAAFAVAPGHSARMPHPVEGAENGGLGNTAPLSGSHRAQFLIPVFRGLSAAFVRSGRPNARFGKN